MATVPGGPLPHELTYFPGFVLAQDLIENYEHLLSLVTWRLPDGTARHFADWQLGDQEALMSEFISIANGKAIPLDEAPPVTILLDDSGNTDDLNVTMFNENLAWSYFLRWVAHSLYVEVAGRVPWSVSAYPEEELSLLLDSGSLFFWYSGSYCTKDFATPGDPGRIYAYLTADGVIKKTAIDTILAFADWCRTHMAHVVGDFFSEKRLLEVWQYKGWPPVERVLKGTTDPKYGFSHWAMACYGSSSFVKLVLRAVNIPVEVITPAGGGCSHKGIHFVHEDLYTSHGDNLYNSWVNRNSWWISSSDLLISKPTYDSWFGMGVSPDVACGHIAGEAAQVAVKYLTDGLLEAYCSDLQEGLDHAHGSVLKNLLGLYSLQSLENGQLWARMDAKIALMGGCKNVP